MSGYPNSNTQLDLGKSRMQEFHKEQEGVKLAKEARNHQPGLVSRTLSSVVNLLTVLGLKAGNQLQSGQALRKKAVALRDQTALPSTHFES